MSESHILLPSKLKVVSDDARVGIYEIEGLYPGYGHTLGNSLRRIILSSLPGAAVTSLKIEGADHEFSTIAGVREDVLSIILSLKKVRFKMVTDEPVTFDFKVKGPRKVTAADIQVPGNVEILNPEQYICEITDKGVEFSGSLTLEKGLGFVTRDHTKEKMTVGAIAVDAIFTPVRKVIYEVENMRVGDKTDHNRLRIHIETDGTYSPREALEKSITIMITQLRSILDLKNIETVKEEVSNSSLSNNEEVTEGNESGDATSAPATDVLKTRLDTMTLSTRTANALTLASIRTLGGLVQKTEEDLLALEGFGNKSLEEIKAILDQFGLTLKS